jgi:hypothetical protein
MAQRKLTLLGAAVFSALLVACAGPGEDRNRSGYSDSGDRGVGTPAQAPDASGPSGPSSRGRDTMSQPTVPSANTPASVPDEQTDRVGQRFQSPPVRDSRLKPSPITPGNVSDSNSSENRNNTTNDGGMGIGVAR